MGWLKSDFSPLPCILKAVLLILAVWAAVLGKDILRDSMLFFAAGALYFGWRGFSKNSVSTGPGHTAVT